jgi:hypothetical protein
MSRKKLLPRLEVAEKFFLTSSPYIDRKIRDLPDSSDSSCRKEPPDGVSKNGSRPDNPEESWAR